MATAEGQGSTDSYFSWDTATLPDGAYYLKIVASDSPSNPADQSLFEERELSDRFEVSNTPPRIENLRADANAASPKVTFDGISPSGALGHAIYSLDGGDWMIIFPTGLLSDSPKRPTRYNSPKLSPGQHTVADSSLGSLREHDRREDDRFRFGPRAK